MYLAAVNLESFIYEVYDDRKMINYMKDRKQNMPRLSETLKISSQDSIM
jgi:hypothetical protein